MTSWFDGLYEPISVVTAAKKLKCQKDSENIFYSGYWTGKTNPSNFCSWISSSFVHSQSETLHIKYQQVNLGCLFIIHSFIGGYVYI